MTSWRQNKRKEQHPLMAVGLSWGGCIVINRQQKEKTRDKTQYGCNVLSHHVDKTGRAVHIIRRTREDENVRGKKQSIK